MRLQGNGSERFSLQSPRTEYWRGTGEHAKEHGIRDVTPQLIERIKASIRDG
jgi:hypothetical protein